MGWLSHPACFKLRDSLLGRLRRPKYRFRNLRPVYFICGGFGSPRRDEIAEYLRKEKPDALVFYADDAWNHLVQSRTDLNALEMESVFAQLSDCVLIVVESPGTFAEVGAFSLSPDLRRKTLAVTNREFRDHPSFLNTGPLNWIARDSSFGGPIHADFGSVLDSIDQILERLARVKHRRTAEVIDICAAPKLLQLLIADIVGIFGPVSVAEVSAFMHALMPESMTSLEEDTIRFHLSLGIALRYLSEVSLEDEVHYLRVRETLAEPYLSKRLFQLEEERLRFIEIAQRLPGGPEFFYRMDSQA
ncbi:MAG: hypothetical protein EVA89_09155 [Sandaracinaceae bacterium]|nr:MAG: hypothetical protein EVA89_09155 [Sandaracinaceae bacterium]